MMMKVLRGYQAGPMHGRAAFRTLGHVAWALCACFFALAPAAVADTWYFRPKEAVTSSGILVYGTGDGSSYQNAKSGLPGNTVGYSAGDTWVVCDAHIQSVTGNYVINLDKQITLDGGCNDESGVSHPGAIRPGDRVVGGSRVLESQRGSLDRDEVRIDFWEGPDANGVYEIRGPFSPGNSSTEHFCENGVPLSPYSGSGAWAAGQYQRIYDSAAGTYRYRYKPTAGEAADHLVTVHSGLPTVSTCPTTVVHGANNVALGYGSGSGWNGQIAAWRKARDSQGNVLPGIYAIPISDPTKPFGGDLRETVVADVAGANLQRLTKQKDPVTQAGLPPPDTGWAEGSYSFVLDASGAFKTLYYRPTDASSGGTPRDHRIYDVSNDTLTVTASDVTIRGLTLRGGANAIEVTGVARTLIEGNDISDTGISISIQYNSDDGIIRDNRIHDTLGSGIYLITSGTTSNAESNDGWLLSRNEIYNIAPVCDPEQYATSSSGSKYCATDRHGIALAQGGGNGNIVEYNHIYSVGGEGIAMYNWSSTGNNYQRNNTIRYNFIHDIADQSPLCLSGQAVCGTGRGIELGSDNAPAVPDTITGNVVHHNVIKRAKVGMKFKATTANGVYGWRALNNTLLDNEIGIYALTNHSDSTLPRYGVEYRNNLISGSVSAHVVLEYPSETLFHTFSGRTTGCPNVFECPRARNDNLFAANLYDPDERYPVPGGGDPYYTVPYHNAPGDVLIYQPDGTLGGLGLLKLYELVYVRRVYAFTLAEWRSNLGVDAGSQVTDPLLANPATGDFAWLGLTTPILGEGDYRLASTSPAINAGVATGLAGDDALDIAGNPVIGLPDIGAYENVDVDGDGARDDTDNCAGVYNADQADGDGDGVGDACDNCTLVANANQRDTNGDGYGNICDADLNNSGLVNSLDSGLMKQKLFTSDPDADLDGNGIVNSLDTGILKKYLLKPPGPSALAP